MLILHLSEGKDEVALFLEGAADNLSREYEISLSMKMGEWVPLGVFLERSDAVGLAYLVKAQVSSEGEKVDSAHNRFNVYVKGNFAGNVSKYSLLRRKRR